MTVTPKEMFFRAVAILVISTEVCLSSDLPKSYVQSPSNDNNNHKNSYEPEFPRPLAVFTERPINVADFVLIPVIQVPSSDLRMIYRPQIDSVSKTEPIIMCKSLTKSFEATPAVQVPLQQPFYLYDERTLIPFPKTVTILHGGYRMSIPVGVVVAPIPAGALRAGPVFVTTLYAIPAGPVPEQSPIPFRFVPWTSYSGPTGPIYLTPPPSPPSPAPSQHTEPAPPSPQYSYPVLPPSPPPQYSQSAPPAPTYYQHSEYSEENSDLRNRDPPGKLYSQYAATAFQNSKESPVLHQLREESEKNRNKYASPSYSNQYQTIDA